MVTVWRMLAGGEGELAEAFEAERVVALGYGPFGRSVQGLACDEIAAIAESRYSERQRRDPVSTLDRFANVMAVDDIVYVRRPDGGYVVGRVTGAYRYAPEPLFSDYHHHRRVEWLGSLTADQVPQRLDRATRGTLIKPPGQQAVLAAIARALAAGDPLPNLPADPDTAAGFDVATAHAATRHIEAGEWVSYRTVAAIAGTRGQALGSHVSRCTEPDVPEHRILRAGGEPSPGFRWVAEPWRQGQTQQRALEEEGLDFPGGVADPAREVAEAALRERLADVWVAEEGHAPTAVPRPLEAGHPLAFVRAGTTPAAVARVEARLVHDLDAWLQANRDVRLEGRHLPTGDGGPPLRVDAFLSEENLLIEAKAGAGRESVRMALGQLLDYRRYFDVPPSMAGLFPIRPTADMVELLHEHGVAVIHRDAETFVIDPPAGGRFRPADVITHPGADGNHPSNRSTKDSASAAPHSC